MRGVAIGLVFLCAMAMASAKPTPADRLAIRVDERIELLSILCRLAGHPEYNRAAKTPYAAAVDAHFAAFREHPAVVATRELRAVHSVSYDAPVGLAVFLDGKTWRPLRALSPLPPGLDPRFAQTPVDEYLEKLRDFAGETGYAEFFAEQAKYRAAVEGRFRAALEGRPVITWYDSIFGERKGASFLLAPGLLTGPMNYGVHAERAAGREDVVQIMMLEDVDGDGLPRPTQQTVELLVHELGHSYVNPALQARADAIEPAAAAAFAKVEAVMRRQKYLTPAIFANEAVVRAMTVLYVRDHGSADEAARVLREQEQLGFAQTAALATALDEARRKGRLSPDALAEIARAVLAR